MVYALCKLITSTDVFSKSDPDLLQNPSIELTSLIPNPLENLRIISNFIEIGFLSGYYVKKDIFMSSTCRFFEIPGRDFSMFKNCLCVT